MSTPQTFDTTYDAIGPMRAPAIVFLHGATATRKQWMPQFDALSDAYRVIAVDLPGHGELAHERFTLDGAAARVEQIIRERTPYKCALVGGPSLGGYVAMTLAHRAPSIVPGLALAGAAINFTGLMGTMARMNAALFPLFPQKWLAGENTRMMRRLFKPEIAEAQIEAGYFFKSAGDVYRDLAGRDFHALLRAYPGPTLVLDGTKDWQNLRYEKTFLAAAQHPTLSHLHGAGHVSNLEMPEDFTDAVRRFAGTVFGQV